jgi:hypothetical protein
MKIFALATVLIALTTSAYSEEAAPAATTTPACKTQSGVTPTRDKPLTGAALKSFMTKCEKDAKADCDKKAADKKLNGAAKTSFTKKCVADEVGA